MINSIARDMVYQTTTLRFRSISTEETARLKLLPYKGDENCVPYAKIFVHYVPTEGRKMMIRCQGRKCLACKHNKATGRVLFYCEDENQEIACFIAPLQFLVALYGKKGKTTEVYNRMISGDSVFSLDNGSVLEIKRNSVGSQEDYHVNIVGRHKTSERVRGGLISAPYLENTALELTESGYVRLEVCLKNGIPFTV